MADSFQKLSVLTAVLKDAWATIQDATATDENIVALKLVKENMDGGVDNSGKAAKVWVPFKTKINRQAGPVAEGAARKDAGYGTYQRAYFETGVQDGVFGIDQNTVEMVHKGDDAAVDMLDAEMVDVKLAINKELAQQLHVDGTGAYGYMPAADNAAAFTVVAPFYGEVGDIINIIDWGDASTTHISNDDAITAISDPTWNSGLPTVDVTITDSPSSTGTNDYVVRSTQADGTGADESKTFNKDTWVGLGAMVDDGNPKSGNYGSLDRTSASYKLWQAQVSKGNTSSSFPYINTTYFRPLSKGLMESLYTVQKRKGGKLDLIICSDAMVQEYLAMESMTINRTPAMVKSVDLGMEGPEFHGKPLIGDPYCLPCRMYFLDKSAIGKKTIWPIGPFPDADRMLQPDLSKSYAYTAAFNTRGQFVSGSPWKNGLLADIMEGYHTRING